MIAALDEAGLEAVMVVEHAAFDDPWSRDQYREELTNVWSRCFVYEQAGAIVGSLVYRSVAGEAELLRVATAPATRRSGVATALMQHMIAACAGEPITLEVRRSNGAAIALYERHGFTTIATRRAYYGDGEDAVIMQRRA